jgi:hypothetical protein
MECPHCNKEIPGVSCPECSETIPSQSNYCLYCGADLKGAPLREKGQKAAEETDDFDLDERIPCSDGNCIGIILNGRCNVCGKRYKGRKK